MSTSSEFYIRNMSAAEFERFYRRLESQRRAQTLAKIDDSIRRHVESAARRERAIKARELQAVADSISNIRTELEEQAECNQKLIAAIEDRLEGFRRQGELAHSKAQAAIRYLKAENAELSKRTDAYGAETSALANSVRELEGQLASEKRRRAEEQASLLSNADGSRRAVAELLGRISEAAARRHGAEHLRKRIDSALTQGQQQSTQGVHQAALALYASAYRDACELEDTIAERIDLEHAVRARIDLAQTSISARLGELATEDAQRYMGQELEGAANEHKALHAALADEPAAWAERLAHLQSIAQRAAELAQRTARFQAQSEALLEKAAAREAVLRGLVDALVEIWGAQFEMEVDYAQPGNPRSPIVFRTKRGAHAPNVQATIGLDGRLEAHFLGYRGTECVRELEAVKRAIQSSGSVQLVEQRHETIPDRPNLPDAGPAELRAPRVEVVEAGPPWGDQVASVKKR